jgi:Ca2+-transporting ATPase
MILLLAGAGVLSAALRDVTEAVVIFVVVVLNAWIGFRQEYRAETAMASLRAMATPTVNVVRDGTAREIPARELVAGDLVLLEAGSRIPADGRLVEAHALRTEESALTGVSVPVEKSTGSAAPEAPLAERTSMSSAVSRGCCRAPTRARPRSSNGSMSWCGGSRWQPRRSSPSCSHWGLRATRSSTRSF